MRRLALIALILASGSIFAVASGGPADAHQCSSAIQIEPGQSQAITVGVPAEASAVIEVFISMPNGFRTSNVQSVGEWRGNQVRNGARFTGGRIDPFGCGFFTVTGVAEKRGELLFPVTTTAEDGSETLFDEKDQSKLHAGQLVYVGPPTDGDATADDGPGGALATGAIVAAVAGGAVFMARRLSRPPSKRRSGRGRPAPAARTRPPSSRSTKAKRSKRKR